MDRFKVMETFVEIVRAGSFAQAARNRRLSRAAVSSHVEQLETHLGVRLFNRNSRKLSLTETGRNYYAFSRRVLADMQKEDEMLTQLGGEPRGRIRIASPPSFANLQLAPLILKFLGRYPDIQIALVLSDSRFRPAEFLDQGLDVALHFSSVLEDTSFIGRKVGTVRWIACASPAYLDRHGAPRTPQELLGHNCLQTRQGLSGPRWTFHGPSGREEIVVRGSLVSNVITTRMAALAGAGIAMLPTYGIADELRTGSLVPILPDYGTEQRDIHALYPHSRLLPKKIRLFLDFLSRELLSERLEPRGLDVRPNSGMAVK